VTETMTWVGLDVHARSIHAAALTLPPGELRRSRFAADCEAVLASVEQPLKRPSDAARSPSHREQAL
jgi:hypothetical protein